MISALATRPLRRRNFLALEIGKTLVIDAQGAHVVFAGGDTKTGGPIEFDYPAAPPNPPRCVIVTLREPPEDRARLGQVE